MDLQEIAGATPRERFFYWVKERWEIYQRRCAGLPKPWTTDHILQTVYFTNVRREDDKTTVWLRTRVREPLVTATDPALPFAVLCFRWFNWIPTGERLLRAGLLRRWNAATAIRLLDGSGQIFTGAFNISNGGSKKPKLQRVCEDYLDVAWRILGPKGERLGKLKGEISLAEAHRILSELPGFGGTGFMAAQVIADLKYTPYLRGASDWWSWCCPGPGSRRGLNLVLGRLVQGPPSPDFVGNVARLRREVSELPGVPELHAQDIQNCLCEFSKYERVRTGGRTKRRYAGDH